MSNALHTPNYQIFRALLVEARKSAGLTQVEVAGLLNKPQSYVSKFERGERRLDFAEFAELADVLGVDIPEFVNRYRQELSSASFLDHSIVR